MADTQVLDPYGQDYQDALYQKLLPQIQQQIEQQFGYARGASFGAQGAMASTLAAKLRMEIALDSAAKSMAHQEQLRKEAVAKQNADTAWSRKVQERERQEDVAKNNSLMARDYNERNAQKTAGAQQKATSDYARWISETKRGGKYSRATLKYLGYDDDTIGKMAQGGEVAGEGPLSMSGQPSGGGNSAGVGPSSPTDATFDASSPSKQFSPSLLSDTKAAPSAPEKEDATNAVPDPNDPFANATPGTVPSLKEPPVEAVSSPSNPMANDIAGNSSFKPFGEIMMGADPVPGVEVVSGPGSGQSAAPSPGGKWVRQSVPARASGEGTYMPPGQTTTETLWNPDNTNDYYTKPGGENYNTGNPDTVSSQMNESGRVPSNIDKSLTESGPGLPGFRSDPISVGDSAESLDQLKKDTDIYRINNPTEGEDTDFNPYAPGRSNAGTPARDWSGNINENTPEEFSKFGQGVSNTGKQIASGFKSARQALFGWL